MRYNIDRLIYIGFFGIFALTIAIASYASLKLMTVSNYVDEVVELNRRVVSVLRELSVIDGRRTILLELIAFQYDEYRQSYQDTPEYLLKKNISELVLLNDAFSDSLFSLKKIYSDGDSEKKIQTDEGRLFDIDTLDEINEADDRFRIIANQYINVDREKFPEKNSSGMNFSEKSDVSIVIEKYLKFLENDLDKRSAIVGYESRNGYKNIFYLSSFSIVIYLIFAIIFFRLTYHMGLSNRILKDQTEKLKASEKVLKQQGSELKMSNTELKDQQKSIKRQSLVLEAAKRSLENKTKELELASQYKSDFLANMSHELRTPLNSVLVLSEDLADNRENNLTQQQQEDAQCIYTCGKELLELINDILDLSKVEAGQLDITVEEVSLHDLMSKMTSLFKRQCDKKGLRLLNELDENLPETISSDGLRIEQILKNFLSNAVKFTASGEIRLSISLANTRKYLLGTQYDEAATVALRVSDSGIGIAKHKQKMIFEAFQQTESSISRQYGGTGLGLTIAKQLTELLGGKIVLQSRLGSGSSFTLYLPIRWENRSILAAKSMNEIDHPSLSARIKSKFLSRSVRSFVPDRSRFSWDSVEDSAEDGAEDSLDRDSEQEVLSHTKAGESLSIYEQNNRYPTVDTLKPSDHKIFSGSRLLLMDSDAVIVYSLAAELSRVGFDVEMAESAEMVINKMSITDPDTRFRFIVLEVPASIRSAENILQSIRAMDGYQSTIIIAVLNDNMGLSDQEALSANVIFKKPIDLEVLLEYFNVHLSE